VDSTSNDLPLVSSSQTQHSDTEPNEEEEDSLSVPEVEGDMEQLEESSFQYEPIQNVYGAHENATDQELALGPADHQPNPVAYNNEEGESGSPNHMDDEPTDCLDSPGPNSSQLHEYIEGEDDDEGAVPSRSNPGLEHIPNNVIGVESNHRENDTTFPDFDTGCPETSQVKIHLETIDIFGTSSTTTVIIQYYFLFFRSKRESTSNI